MPFPNPFLSPLPFCHQSRLLYLSTFLLPFSLFICTFLPKSAAFITQPLFLPTSLLSLPFLFSLFPSISPGCGVLHPGSVFRVITRLVNSFMDSTLSVTHYGQINARLQCNQLTYAHLTSMNKDITCGFI